jgi:hypothetical protein
MISTNQKVLEECRKQVVLVEDSLQGTEHQINEVLDQVEQVLLKTLEDVRSQRTLAPPTQAVKFTIGTISTIPNSCALARLSELVMSQVMLQQQQLALQREIALRSEIATEKGT